MRRRLGPFVILALIAAAAVFFATRSEERPKNAESSRAEKGRLEKINGCWALHLEGTPEEMGRQHGLLFKETIKKVVKALVTDQYKGDKYGEMLKGAKVMEHELPDEFRREMKALAEAAGADYWDIVIIQLFGDIGRAQGCTSFAMFGPATKGGECIAGRNMDYWDNGVSEYAAVLIHYKPDKGHEFLTVSWAGIINGWTLMNAKGLVTSNNSAFDARANSLEGVSTCFLLRKVAQYASTVDEGVKILRESRRACGTNVLIATANPADAAVVEFDNKGFEVRRARDGCVMAANSFLKLYNDGEDAAQGARLETLLGLIKANYGKIDRTMNFAGADGVPITFINLHSAMLFPKDLIIKISMGKCPAYKQPYKSFQMKGGGLVALDE